jgi:hypothetical protein
MQTLGLSQESRRSDGRLKSIFWPTVENAWDVDALGRQGFWLCVILAGFQLALAVASRNPFMIVSGAAVSLVFLIGAMGVREKNWPAAALLFSLFSINILYSVASFQFPGFLTIVADCMLLSNLRAAFLASEWRPAAEDEDKPMRFNDTIGEKLSDRMPARAWPVLRIPFFSLASLLLLLSIAGLGFLLLQSFGLVPHASALQP